MTQNATTTTVANGSLIKLQLSITSDNICPFCYIGYKKMEKAIAMAKEENIPVDVHIQFKPYLLDPSLPMLGGKSKVEVYKKKFGDRTDSLMEKLKGMGTPYGIKFNPTEGNVGNTTNSHRLLEYAYEKGGETQQRKLIEYLFNGYFERAQDIANIDFLTESAMHAGTFSDTQSAQDWLRGSEGLNEVEESCREAAAMGITGVPFTVINGKYAISGAQEPESFLQVFKQIAAKCGALN